MAHRVKVLPGAASCGDQEEMGLGRDEPVCILIKHCRDMKQQETRLRLITMLLLLGCSALYIFTICAELRKREHQRSGEQRAADPIPEKQQAAEKKRFSFDFRSKHQENRSDGQDIQWKQIIPSENHCDQERRDIVIPEDGVYFIYIRTSLSCRNDSGAALSNMFHMELSHWNENYDEPQLLTRSRDVVSCPPVDFRTVSVDGLFELTKGDHLSVRIVAGYKLLDESTIGFFFVSAL